MPKFKCDILSNFQTMWLQFCIFSDHETRVLAKAGDAFCFLATLQHCAMPNLSQSSRSVILIQYLAKYVRPMEDQKRMLKESVRKLNNKKITLFEIFIFCPKIQLLISRDNCRFFFGWKIRENVGVLYFLAVDNFNFTRKIVKKNLDENSWKC